MNIDKLGLLADPKEQWDLDRVDHMYKVAKKHHDATGAIRKHSGDPYIVHPEGVAELVAAYGGTENQVMAAFAHDLIEDTDVDFDFLNKKFGEDVANIVAEITNDRDEIDRVGKEAYITRELVNLSHDALLVKLCDILYNCLDYPSNPQIKRMKKNVEELVDLRDDLEENEEAIIEDILDICNRKRLGESRLFEVKISDLLPDGGVSGITQKWLDKRYSEGDSRLDFAEAKYFNRQYLQLVFFAASTYGGTSFIGAPDNDLPQAPNGYYTLVLRFLKPDMYLRNIETMNDKQLAQALKKVFEACDVKLFSDDPSFYWQGSYEDLSKHNACVYKFSGENGDGTWRNRHFASGGLDNSEIKLTKHLAQLLDTLDYYIPEIVKAL